MFVQRFVDSLRKFGDDKDDQSIRRPVAFFAEDLSSTQLRTLKCNVDHAIWPRNNLWTVRNFEHVHNTVSGCQMCTTGLSLVEWSSLNPWGRL